MSVLKVDLKANFMRGIIAKIVEKQIVKKTGYKAKIFLNGIEVETTTDGRITLHVDVDAEMNKDDFMKIVKDNGLI